MLQDRESAVGYAHEHISPIWSASVAIAGHIVPAIATPYYCNGNINSYTRLYPRTDRFELVRQTVSALVHIHSKDVVHGGICPVSFCLGRSWILSGLLITFSLADKYMHRRRWHGSSDRHRRRHLRTPGES
jgi:hypothetical protein